MLNKLQELSESFDEKVPVLVDALKDADPTTEDYKKLLENYALTMTVASNLNKTLLAIANAAAEKTETKEEK